MPADRPTIKDLAAKLAELEKKLVAKEKVQGAAAAKLAEIEKKFATKEKAEEPAAAKLAELEKKLVTKEKVEEMAAAAALVELEKKLATKEKAEEPAAAKLAEIEKKLVTREKVEEIAAAKLAELEKKLATGEKAEGPGDAAALAELEKKIITREKAKEIAAAAALDVLKFYEKEVRDATEAARELTRAFEKREFARRVAASLDDRAIRRSLDDLVVETLQDELEQAVGQKIKDAFSSQLEDPEFAGKLKEIAGGGEDVKEFAKGLAERMDRIEREALPQLVEKLLDKKVDKKLDEKLQEKLEENLDAVPFGAIVEPAAEGLDAEAVQQKVIEVARGSVREIVNTPEFKAVLEDKFKVVMNYLTQDVIPKQIRRMMGG